MKKFIKNIILFSIVLLFASFLVQILICYRIKGKTIRGYDNLELTSNINADLVLLGSSRCYAHFDPVFFKKKFNVKTVNIGVDGHTEIAMASIRLKNYLSKNKAPKYAILNFDPFTAAGNEDNNVNYVHKDAFARYSFLPNKKDLDFVNCFKFNFKEKYIPLYSIFKYRLFIDCLTLKNGGNYVKYGFEKHEESWDTLSKPITNILKKCFSPKKEEYSTIKALKELNALCLRNKIKLLCIQTPVYKIIYDAEIFNNIGLISSKANIPFIDVNKESIRNNINCFYNSNHLNANGVEHMNQYLDKDTILNNFFK